MAIILESELKSKKTKLVYAVIYAFLAVFAVIQFMPLYWMIIGTFKTNIELQSAIPTIIPKMWTFEGYKDVFTNFNILQNILNTAFFCGSIILVQTITSTFAAFSLSRIKSWYNPFVYTLIIATQMISTTTLLFPTYILLTKWGLIGNKLSWVLMSSGWGYAIVLYKNFFDGIPKDLFEAAEIDGAGIFKQIWYIMIPLSKAIFAVNILNTFMAVYNDFLLPVMILPDEKDWTLMMRVFMMDKKGNVELNTMYVFLFVTTIPSILFYLLAQKNIVRGVSADGIKG